MDFQGFHIKYLDAATGNSKGMFVSGIFVDEHGIVTCKVAPRYAGKDFQCKAVEVVQIHVTDAGNHVAAKFSTAPPKLETTGKNIEDAVIAFTNARLDEGPLGLAFLQTCYAYWNTKPALNFKMSTIYSNIAESLRKAVKQLG